MKTAFILIAFLFFSFFTFSQKFPNTDSIFVIVTNDSITIMDTNATRTCGSRFVLNAFRNGNDITVLETDTALNHQRCMCHFDMYITIGMLPVGTYNVYIKQNVVDWHSDTTDVGTTSFVIEEKKSSSDSLNIISTYASRCGGTDYTSVMNLNNKDIKLSVYPNPFNNNSTISFQLKKTSAVSLKLFDISEKEVECIINKNLEKGNHEINYSSNLLKPGIYFLHLNTPDKSECIKLSVILKSKP